MIGSARRIIRSYHVLRYRRRGFGGFSAKSNSSGISRGFHGNPRLNSEGQSQLQLNGAGRTRSCNLAKIDIGQVRGNVRVLRVIQQVLHVRPEFEILLLCQRKILRQRDVHVVHSGTSKSGGVRVSPPNGSAGVSVDIHKLEGTPIQIL